MPVRRNVTRQEVTDQQSVSARLPGRSAQAGQQGVDGQVPPAVHGRPGAAQPSGRLLGREALAEREQHVGDVLLVAGDDAGVDAPAYPRDDELPGGVPRFPFLRTRIEVGERPGEHELSEHRVVADEYTEGADHVDEIAL